MPPPSLSITTMRTGVETSRRDGQAADVVQEAEVAGDDRGRPAGRVGGADARGDQAVDAVGAAVAEEARRRPRSTAGRPPGRGSACSRRCRRARRRRRRRRGRAAAPGSVIAPAAGQLGRDRLARRALGLHPHRRRRPLLAEARRPASRQLGRVGAQQRRRPASRLVPVAERVDDDLLGARPGQPGAQRLARRQLAEAQHEVRRGGSAEPLVAQQQVVGGDDVRAVVGAAADLRGRLGEDRVAGGARQVGERLAQLGVELAPGDDHADLGRGDVARRPRRAGTARAPRRAASRRSAGGPRRGPPAPARRWR